jgi:hypothetical protein
MLRSVWSVAILAAMVFAPTVAFAEDAVRAVPPSRNSKPIARCGAGWLEEVDGYQVVHLKGTPYEMGFQHGSLLKDRIKSNMHNLLTIKGGESVKIGPISVKPSEAIKMIIGIQKEFVPPRYFEELAGLAAGCGMDPDELILANFIPELFHCSGFAVMNSATKSGELYHGRVLDYAVDWGLQDHAVIIVAEPEGRKPWVNVSYAGFIGCVTGMNAAHVSIGEMGGGGLGHWEGVPMAFLVREALETADDLDSAIAVFRDNPRTCQYFYVIADGKTNRAVGMEASWNVFTTIGPGEHNPLLPRPVKDAVLLSAGSRYEELVRRTLDMHGRITPDSAIGLMDCPVAMKSNLHNVLFAPKSTRFWVANATTDKKPAANQKYAAFELNDLLSRKPGDSVLVLPAPDTSVAASAAASQ